MLLRSGDAGNRSCCLWPLDFLVHRSQPTKMTDPAPSSPGEVQGRYAVGNGQSQSPCRQTGCTCEKEKDMGCRSSFLSKLIWIKWPLPVLGHTGLNEGHRESRIEQGPLPHRKNHDLGRRTAFEIRGNQKLVIMIQNEKKIKK